MRPGSPRSAATTHGLLRRIARRENPRGVSNQLLVVRHRLPEEGGDLGPACVQIIVGEAIPEPSTLACTDGSRILATSIEVLAMFSIQRSTFLRLPESVRYDSRVMEEKSPAAELTARNSPQTDRFYNPSWAYKSLRSAPTG